MNVGPVSVPATTLKRSLPLGLTAEIRLTRKRAPLVGTTGVWPTGAQVVPEWKSERTDASSPK